MRRSVTGFWLFLCATVLIAGSAVLPRPVRAQSRPGIVLSGGNTADVARLQAMYQAEQQHQAALAAIASDKASYISSLVARWSADIMSAGGERVLKGLQLSLMSSDAEKLFEISQAPSYDSFVQSAFDGRAAGPNVLGSSSSDLVFFPLTAPCRALDTRFAAGGYAGPYAANSDHAFAVTDPLDFFGSQGGSALCGIPVGPTKAVALNIVAVGPATYGDFRLYPYSGTAPNASVLNYSPGQNIANGLVVPICLGCAQDLRVITDASSSHVIVDVLGYFAAPLATALSCVNTADTATSVAAGTNFSLNSVACASGYTSVSVNCRSGTFNTVNYASVGANTGGADCQGTNTSGGSITMHVSQLCCRVPGR